MTNETFLGNFGGLIAHTLSAPQQTPSTDKHPAQSLSNENIDRIATYTVKYLGAVSKIDDESKNIIKNVNGFFGGIPVSNQQKKSDKKPHLKALRPDWFTNYYSYTSSNTGCFFRSEYLSAPFSMQALGVFLKNDKYKNKFPTDNLIFTDKILEQFQKELATYDAASAQYDDGYDTVFWYLFLAAVNENIYRDRFDEIIDTAGSYGFTEEMVRDWCRAVQFVVEGGRLSPTCGLELDSAAAREFFLHETANEDD